MNDDFVKAEFSNFQQFVEHGPRPTSANEEPSTPAPTPTPSPPPTPIISRKPVTSLPIPRQIVKAAPKMSAPVPIPRPKNDELEFEKLMKECDQRQKVAPPIVAKKELSIFNPRN